MSAAAAADVQRLAELRTTLLNAKDDYWALQVEIQHRIARAWIASAEGRRDEALALLRETAAMEDGTDKSAVSPGPLAPAREMLGDMLLEMKRPADALTELEAVMKKEPNRFRTLYLAAKAASSVGDATRVRNYSRQLVEMCAKGDAADRPELAEMKRAGQ
jgi:predicted Zn-dependent protease